MPLNNGVVIGQPLAAKAGMEILEKGGNAVDAAITAALVAGVVALPATGIGGYGGTMVVGLASGKVTSFDFNSEAPSNPPDKPYLYGWLAAGVPGVLAGLDMALHRYGTLNFRQALQPAIRYAAEGIPIPAPMATVIRNNTHLAADPASKKLYYPVSEVIHNPDLARMLEILAKENSSEPFYRGAMAREIARQFELNGGRVTEKDMNAYEAREVAPLKLKWKNNQVVYTTPLTSGGATVLQALASLRGVPGVTPHARLEALRLAWQDRLTLLGDPNFSKVPVDRLLSDRTADRAAKRIRQAIAAASPLEVTGRKVTATGTVNICAADASGNMVAVTLTHGNGFGACVTVPGFGLTLGHGMSRFEDQPGHPNAIGPRKRPLHNMCPAIVTENGKPLLAVGATGGRKIPNAVFDVLCRYLIEGMAVPEAIAAPRMNTTGGLDVALTKDWDGEEFSKIGFRVKTEAAAVASAVCFRPALQAAQH